MVIKYSLPSLAIVAVSGSYNIVDGIFLGRSLGITANSVNSYVFLLYMVIFSFCILISQGACTILTIYLGEKKQRTAEDVIGTSIFLAIIVSLILAIVIKMNLNNITNLLNISSEDRVFFNDYFNNFLQYLPIYFLSHILTYILRAQGKAFLVMCLSFQSFAVNVLLGFIFIITLNWGFTGSSASTIGANLSSCIISYIYMKGKKRNIKLCLEKIKYNKILIQEVITTGVPQFIMNLASVFLLLIYNEVAKHYAGYYGLAALSIGSSIYRYITLVMNAITNGIQPIIGYNYGAQNFIRVKKTLNFTLALASIISCTLTFLIQFYAIQIIKLYNYNDLNFEAFAVVGIRLVLLALPLQGIISISTSYFQNIKKTKVSMILIILRQVVFQIPLAIGLPYVLGINGLWHSFWISDVMIAIVSIFLLNINRKKLKGDQL
ncbi:matE family protein [Clostridioides difficile CD45]|uniref:MATE family efflux transporter n=1 Tax=Clostridioides difficile TaxID=1496 RepID=UPI00038C7A83|nr:MATE family efflux transporter [Clostridioides difficile]EGT4016461.1 multidrug transporter MatE [Clostridioides difficile]EJA6846934.1 hypothetical protein [Clostridioides difficile]EQE60352.1 matE family protein [Clostridioides difficile CD45]MBH7523803.1 hypothetical protein [Clostridioides difficile]MBY1847542.1 hypothetical protein [Clostridioides difficile]